MAELSTELLDWPFLWTWFLLNTRMTGVLIALPGIGTAQVSAKTRMPFALIIGLTITMAGIRAPLPENMIMGGIMIGCEFLLGYALAALPAFIISSLAITGQVVSGAIGLGFANLIDPSIGQNVAILARIEGLVATLIFLLVDGHHIVLQAVAGVGSDMPVGVFRPDMDMGLFMLDRFVAAFELAVVCSAPILVSILVTQFVLGLITKSVPQVNIFIISLPLTIGLGLYITAFTFPGMIENLIREFRQLEELSAQILAHY